MAARIRKVRLTDEWRQKIQAGNIMTRLLKHVNGEVEMTTSQVNAAKILLGKIVPDLASVEMGNKDDKPFVINIAGTDAGLL